MFTYPIHSLLYADSNDKPNIWQMKKKERKDFRRKQDDNYNLVHSLKQLYESIRRFVKLSIESLLAFERVFRFQYCQQ